MPELPPPSPEAAAHSRRLVDAIRAEIETAGGWISFARYMELALYAPGLGYYASGATKFGSAGDFVTAPEISPLFARALARPIAAVLRETGGGVLELGAGSGRLAMELLLELDRLGVLPNRYLILEVSADLRHQQDTNIARLPAGLARRVIWLDTPPVMFSGVMFGNEVLDALPVHLVRWDSHETRERGVIWRDDGFAFDDRPMRNRVLHAAAARVRAEPGYLSEIPLAAPALVRSLAERLVRGVMLWIDYGFPVSEYYHPQRREGTLMCHYRHRSHADPFLFPGLQDITAHVDFSAISEAGTGAGLDLLGYWTQARFLIGCGITDLLAETPAENASRYLPLASGVQKLLSPAEMGELFKVIALGRDIGVPLAGVAEGTPPHGL